jgi:uncharacterized protein (DUF427 family)
MAAAIWKGTRIAESNKTIVVEGNHYFPPESIHMEFLRASPATSRCPWKGMTKYYSIVVGANTNEDAAWCYSNPSKGAANIRGYVAFWNGVEVK